jgi:hypothetical protein
VLEIQTQRACNGTTFSQKILLSQDFYSAILFQRNFNVGDNLNYIKNSGGRVLILMKSKKRCLSLATKELFQ